MKEKIQLLKLIFQKAPENKSFIVTAKDLIRWLIKNKGQLYVFYMIGLYKKEKNFDDYITDSEYQKIHSKCDPPYYRVLLEDKISFDALLHLYNFPTPEFVGILEKGKYIGKHDRDFVSLDKILPHNIDVFCKSIYSWGGKGIFKLKVENGNVFINEEKSDIETLHSIVKDGKYMLQKSVIQHEGLSRLNPYCVNTLRVVTITNGSEPIVLFKMLRVGVNKSFVDNASKGNLIVGIDDNGYLKSAMFNSIPPKEITHHPDTNTEFESVQIPYFEETKKLCIDIHKRLNNFLFVGWDVAIQKDGPVIIEGNPVARIGPLQVNDDGARAIINEYAAKFMEFKGMK